MKLFSGLKSRKYICFVKQLGVSGSFLDPWSRLAEMISHPTVMYKFYVDHPIQNYF